MRLCQIFQYSTPATRKVIQEKQKGSGRIRFDLTPYKLSNHHGAFVDVLLESETLAEEGHKPLILPVLPPSSIHVPCMTRDVNAKEVLVIVVDPLASETDVTPATVPWKLPAILTCIPDLLRPAAEKGATT